MLLLAQARLLAMALLLALVRLRLPMLQAQAWVHHPRLLAQAMAPLLALPQHPAGAPVLVLALMNADCAWSLAKAAARVRGQAQAHSMAQAAALALAPYQIHLLASLMQALALARVQVRPWAYMPAQLPRTWVLVPALEQGSWALLAILLAHLSQLAREQAQRPQAWALTHL